MPAEQRMGRAPGPVLHTDARDRLDAASVTGDKTVCQLSPARPGKLVLAFARRDGQTWLTHIEQTPPWKAIRGFRSDASGAALLHLQNISGGLLSGDYLTASIEVGAGADVQITTTGSTRIYRAPEGGLPAAQEVRFKVGEGALLEYIPDSVIPFRRSRYRQQTRFELSSGAGLFAWELIAPGRSGEPFGFLDLLLTTEILVDRQPIAFEHWRTRPTERRQDHMLRLSSFVYQATFHVCHTGLPRERWLLWEREMAELAQSRESRDEVWGVSTLQRDGLVFRGLAVEGLFLNDTMVQFWRGMKKRLYGKEPVLPRKMF